MATTVAFKCLIHTTTSLRLQMWDGYAAGRLLHRVGDIFISSPSQYVFFYLLILLTPLIISGLCVWTTNIQCLPSTNTRGSAFKVGGVFVSSPACLDDAMGGSTPLPLTCLYTCCHVFLYTITDDEIYTVFSFWILYWLLNWVYGCLNLLLGVA